MKQKQAFILTSLALLALLGAGGCTLANTISNGNLRKKLKQHMDELKAKLSGNNKTMKPYNSINTVDTTKLSDNQTFDKSASIIRNYAVKGIDIKRIKLANWLKYAEPRSILEGGANYATGSNMNNGASPTPAKSQSIVTNTNSSPQSRVTKSVLQPTTNSFFPTPQQSQSYNTKANGSSYDMTPRNYNQQQQMSYMQRRQQYIDRDLNRSGGPRSLDSMRAQMYRDVERGRLTDEQAQGIMSQYEQAYNARNSAMSNRQSGYASTQNPSVSQVSNTTQKPTNQQPASTSQTVAPSQGSSAQNSNLYDTMSGGMRSQVRADTRGYGEARQDYLSGLAKAVQSGQLTPEQAENLTKQYTSTWMKYRGSAVSDYNRQKLQNSPRAQALRAMKAKKTGYNGYVPANGYGGGYNS